MRSALVASVVVILVAATFGAGYLAGNVNRGTVTITSASTSIGTSTTTVSTSSPTTPSSSGSPAEVVLVTGPIPPYTPGGPEVGVTVMNIGQVPIASLSASLALPADPSSPYAFVFDVNSSSPLLPGQSIQALRGLINGGFDSSQEYPLAISGALSNGTQFSYSVQVEIVPPSV